MLLSIHFSVYLLVCSQSLILPVIVRRSVQKVGVSPNSVEVLKRFDRSTDTSRIYTFIKYFCQIYVEIPFKLDDFGKLGFFDEIIVFGFLSVIIMSVRDFGEKIVSTNTSYPQIYYVIRSFWCKCNVFFFSWAAMFLFVSSFVMRFLFFSCLLF